MRKRRRKEAMEPSSPAVRAAILEIVDNQLTEGRPAETRQTFDRLLREGHTPTEARRLIGCVVTSEIYDVMKRGEPFDEARFVALLHRLPRLPWEP